MEIVGGRTLGLPQFARTFVMVRCWQPILGDDADTTAAIYGQIAGAHYGARGIPGEWRQLITMAPEITSMADSLYDHCRRSSPAKLDEEEAYMTADVTERTGLIRGREYAMGQCHRGGSYCRTGPVVRRCGG